MSLEINEFYSIPKVERHVLPTMTLYGILKRFFQTPQSFKSQLVQQQPGHLWIHLFNMYQIVTPHYPIFSIRRLFNGWAAWMSECLRVWKSRIFPPCFVARVKFLLSFPPSLQISFNAFHLICNCKCPAIEF